MTSEPDQGAPKPASRPRAGVPVWRTGKPDAVLAAAADFARTAVGGIAPASQIGRHLGAKTEGDRVVTHLFESLLAGYQGWQWYAVLTRNSRSKVITVNELGLLPSEDSILAPEWVPWAERVRPEDAQDDETADAETADAETADAGAAVDGIAVDAADDAAADDTAPDLMGEATVFDDDEAPVSDDDEDAGHPESDAGQSLREAD
ncbi:DUF3027 domain-containing protein [Arthrobacter sp. ISL-69]|uniref:DUF3027 domain-containing protein n=1 Tax=Arthrobacter sp. ISL-69 TaxID=2819113 RepID=UPI001BEAC471|nr:DUF3027 domain-containing protein [Arthrobacter sp. ISL-69]MBT2535217.1 DUF3027 domain-containing protein [Arthrobacter sp. ISL-69]